MIWTLAWWEHYDAFHQALNFRSLGIQQNPKTLQNTNI
jgi:hypothetical protein